MLFEVPDPNVRQTLDAIRRIVRDLRESSTKLEKRMGLSAAQLFVLRTAAREPNLSLNDLSQRTMTHQSSVSVVVKKLIERGLLTRRGSVADGRRAEVAVTQRGKALLRRAGKLPQERLIEAALKLRPAERIRLARGLERLVQNMGIAESRATMFFEDTGKRSLTKEDGE